MFGAKIFLFQNNKYYQLHVRQQAGFEIPPVLKASKILPKELHESKIYKISENVYSDGVADHFEINSKWGKARAGGFLVLIYWTKGTYMLYKETLEAIKDDGINLRSIETRINGILTLSFKNELANLGIKLKYVDNVEYSIKLYNQ